MSSGILESSSDMFLLFHGRFSHTREDALSGASRIYHTAFGPELLVNCERAIQPFEFKIVVLQELKG